MIDDGREVDDVGDGDIPKNAGKNPAFLLYPNDWSRDLEEHPLEVEGAWIRLICKLWYSQTKGTLTRTLDQWSRILREPVERTRGILEYIKREGIGDVTFRNGKGEFSGCADFAEEDIPGAPVTNRNGDGNEVVTVQCRRMVRDEVLREQNRKRQEEYRRRKLLEKGGETGEDEGA